MAVEGQQNGFNSWCLLKNLHVLERQGLFRRLGHSCFILPLLVLLSDVSKKLLICKEKYNISNKQIKHEVCSSIYLNTTREMVVYK